MLPNVFGHTDLNTIQYQLMVLNSLMYQSYYVPSACVTPIMKLSCEMMYPKCENGTTEQICRNSCMGLLTIWDNDCCLNLEIFLERKLFYKKDKWSIIFLLKILVTFKFSILMYIHLVLDFFASILNIYTFFDCHILIILHVTFRYNSIPSCTFSCVGSIFQWMLTILARLQCFEFHQLLLQLSAQWELSWR